MKKAVITILGLQGGRIENDKATFTNIDNIANYYFEDENESTKKEYFNTLPLLIEKYSDEYEIIPIYTKDSKTVNQAVLAELYSKLNVDFNETYFIEDEKNFKEVFSLFNKTLEKFDEVIIDVTHGFRHLPLLMLVELLIHNFRDTKKIQKILFAKEKLKHTRNDKGLYEIIDLKEYLELANISFILTTFEKNYTVANHIESEKYKKLIDALNDFSNDLMALNLNNLFENSIDELKDELNMIDDVSISTQAKNLYQHIDKVFKQSEKRYLTYYNLSRELFDKKYMLISLSLLNESLRLYIKTAIKKENKEIVERIEAFYEEDLYKIGDFFVKLYSFNKKEDKYINKMYKDIKSIKNITKEKRLQDILSESDFLKLINSFPSKLKEQIKINDEEKILTDHIGHKRNNLAHANSSTVSFDTIHDDIKSLIEEFENRCKI